VIGPPFAGTAMVLLALALGVAVLLALGVIVCQHRRGRWRAGDPPT
jgi:hypothetical protein